MYRVEVVYLSRINLITSFYFIQNNYIAVKLLKWEKHTLSVKQTATDSVLDEQLSRAGKKN